MYRLPVLPIAFLVVLAATGCGGDSPGGGTGPTPDPSVPTTVTVTAPKTLLEFLGETVQLVAQVRDQRGAVMSGVSVSWSSSTTSCAEVGSGTGLVTARGEGTTTITASAQGRSGSVTITVTQSPSQFQKVQGDQQTGTVGEALAVTPRVRVNDSGGSPISGETVAFEVTSGNGLVSAQAVTTDAVGLAEVTWTLGTDASTDQTLSASVDGLSLDFTATANPDDPSQVTITNGNQQTGFALEDLDNPISVLVTDQYGNPIQGAAVIWLPALGHGTLTGAATTDAEGKAQATWTLGGVDGVQSGSVSVGALAPVGFTATAQSNAIIQGTVTFTGGMEAPPMPTPEMTGLPLRPPFQRSQIPPPPEPVPVPGELIVTYHSGPIGAPQLGSGQYQAPETAVAVSSSIQAAVSRTVPSQVVERVDISPAILAARIKVSDPDDLPAVEAALRQDPQVASVERNMVQRMNPPPSPSPAQVPVFPSEQYYPFQAWHYEMIRLPEAWSITTGSANVTVAVVDDGIRFDHPDLAPNLTADGYDFVTDSNLPLCLGGWVSASGDGDGPDPDPTTPTKYEWTPVPGCVSGLDQYGAHGTHVAGTIGAVQNGEGVTGVNWNVRIRPVRVISTSGQATFWDESQGILYAAGLPASGAGGGIVQAPYPSHVINMSFGGPTFTADLQNAVQAASGAGSLLVAAAGNGDTSQSQYPAAFPEVISVSAVNPDYTKAAYSNFGPWIDIGAPGGVDLMPGDWSYGVYSTIWNFQTNWRAWFEKEGTSFAAPHVSGVAALILANEPGLSAAEVRSRLLTWASGIGDPDHVGNGLLDAYTSLRNGQVDPRDLYVRLFNAETGAVISTVPVEQDGSYQFSHLPSGQYYLFAGHDENMDGEIGLLNRSWGAYGGTASPTPIVVAGSGVQTVNTTFGWPTESEGNDTEPNADVLMVGGYQNGMLGTETDVDVYRILIPESGTYTVQTFGWAGACGLARQANTKIQLFNSAGGLVTLNDDIDFDGFDLCSRFTRVLDPGTYFLHVSGSDFWPLRGSQQKTGIYRVRILKDG